jgi:hypothetical protein
MSTKMPTLASGHSTLTAGLTQRNHPLESFSDSDRNAPTALGAKDPDELLKIVQEFSHVLRREEEVQRDFREAMRTDKASA